MQDLELRKQVAIACGYCILKEITENEKTRLIASSGIVMSDAFDVPEYELSIDAIAEKFDKKGWDWDLEKYQAGFVSCSGDFNLVFEANTGAIALCKLFLAIHEQENK